MLVNVDYFRKNNFFETAVDYYGQRREHILWWDQDILNGLLYNKVYLLPYKWNVKTGDFQPEILAPADRAKWSPDITRDAKIIHFTGSFKPWHYKNTHPRKADYFYYLRKTRFKRYNPLIEHIKMRISNKLRVFLKGRE
jgi:lipopolysaccharide biosynthesis glycosyltransferase